MKYAMTILLAVFMLWTAGVACAQETDLAADAKAVIDQLFTDEAGALYDRMSDAVRTQLSKADLEAVGPQLEAMGGKVTGYYSEQVLGGAVVLGLEMENMRLIAQITFDAEGKIAGLGFVPDTSETRDTSVAENEEEIAVGPHALEGLLTIPKGDADTKWPAVVLVHGSGPNDRNETLGNLALFRDLAEGLSEKGIAVIRYDKRTFAMQQGKIAYTQEDLGNLTFDAEVIEDALAAVALAKADPRIDPDRVFLLGHSLGGIMANRIESQGAQTAGLVIWAGSLRQLSEILVDQYTVLDIGTEDMQQEIETARNLGEMSEEEARESTLLGGSAYQMWEAMRHDQKQIAADNDVPLLVMQGAMDQKVYADRDYVLWEAFAAEYPEKDITLKLYEGLGHEFVDAQTGKVSQPVIDDIAAWVLER